MGLPLRDMTATDESSADTESLSAAQETEVEAQGELKWSEQVLSQMGGLQPNPLEIGG